MPAAIIDKDLPLQVLGPVGWGESPGFHSDISGSGVLLACRRDLSRS